MNPGSNVPFRLALRRARSAASVSIPVAACLCVIPMSLTSTAGADGARRNILVLLMDDVGIDQLTSFNPHAPNPQHTPTLDALVAGGVRFTDCWAMPVCSPKPAMTSTTSASGISAILR